VGGFPFPLCYTYFFDVRSGGGMATRSARDYGCLIGAVIG
jgi:hypothetical protein